MTIDKAIEAKILRYHHVEGWGVHTIASQLGVHHSTVDRVLSLAGLPKIDRATRDSIIDPYLSFMVDTLEQYPTLSAKRLFEMVKVRGYTGGVSHFRARVAQLRPRKKPEAYLRLSMSAGEVCQTDWGHFGHVQIGRAQRPLMAFVMVLGWSRQVFLRFYLNARTPNFLQGHVDAFEAWGGAPRACWYDNLKSAVLERDGTAIRYNPQLLELAAHYRFEPRAMNVYRGNEKGRVERAIRTIRSSFFAARQWDTIEQLNEQAEHWCAGVSGDRPWPEDNALTVREAFTKEQQALVALPATAFAADERVQARVGKTPYVRFDRNDYSLPAEHVRTTVTLLASATQIRILGDTAQQIAQHQRCWDKGQQIEVPEHLEALRQAKRQASKAAGQNRLRAAVPASGELLSLAAQRGYSLRTMVRALQRLLDEYGAEQTQLACVEALERDVPHENAVRQSLERRREERHLPPPLALALPDNDKARYANVQSHSLADYDQIHSGGSRANSDNTDTDTDDNTNPIEEFL